MQSLGLLLLNLTRVLAAFIVLHGLGAGVDTLVVLLHDEVGLGLTEVRTDEFRIQLDGLIAVLDSRRESKKLDVAGSSV